MPLLKALIHLVHRQACHPRGELVGVLGAQSGHLVIGEFGVVVARVICRASPDKNVITAVADKSIGTNAADQEVTVCSAAEIIVSPPADQDEDRATEGLWERAPPP